MTQIMWLPESGDDVGVDIICLLAFCFSSQLLKKKISFYNFFYVINKLTFIFLSHI